MFFLPYDNFFNLDWKVVVLLYSFLYRRYFRLGNYKRFICTIEAEASYLQYCIIEPYISEVVPIIAVFSFSHHVYLCSLLFGGL